MSEFKALLLKTTDGNSVLVHFGPGCVIRPKVNPNSGVENPKITRISVCGGAEFSVVGNWADIARRAGYGDVVKGKAIESKPARKPAEPDDAPPKTPDDPSSAAATSAAPKKPDASNEPTGTTAPIAAPGSS